MKAMPWNKIKKFNCRYERTTQGLAWFFACVRLVCWKVLEERWPTSQDAKIMTARSPDDSAGEHNKGSGWTAACWVKGDGMKRNEVEWTLRRKWMKFVVMWAGSCGSLWPKRNERAQRKVNVT
jgi:hypothetical protein